MEYKKNQIYRDIPFTFETPQEDFYLYDAVRNLHSKCESRKDRILRVRTVGILTNINGSFYIKQMISRHVLSNPTDPKQSIQLSIAYMNSSVPYSTMPYPVQVFGKMQWCHRPIIFALIVQPLSVSVATLLHESMIRVSTLHSSRQSTDTHEFD